MTSCPFSLAFVAKVGKSNLTPDFPDFAIGIGIAIDPDTDTDKLVTNPWIAVKIPEMSPLPGRVTFYEVIIF